MGNSKISMKKLNESSKNIANFQCNKCFEYHVNVEVTKLSSALKDYTHFAVCPIKSVAVFVNMDNKNEKTK